MISDACEWTVWPRDSLRYSWKNGQKLKTWQISRSDPPMSFRIFEQPKEDSSENISDKTLAYFFTCFLYYLC